jgi:hypothetical protein
MRSTRVVSRVAALAAADVSITAEGRDIELFLFVFSSLILLQGTCNNDNDNNRIRIVTTRIRETSEKRNKQIEE